MAEIKKYLDQVALGALVDQIKAADAKVLQGAKDYCDGKDSMFEAAGAAATAEAKAKGYADEKVQALADGQVKLNKEAIEKLNGAADVEGSVAKAIADAKALIDADVDAVEAIANKNKEDIAAINNAETGILALAKKFASEEDAKVQANVDALAGKVGVVPEGSTVMGIIQNIQENAYDDTAIQNAVAELESNKADKTQVALDIAAAVEDEAEARAEAIGAVQGEVDALEQAHATDKKDLEDAIALKADQTALDDVSEVANAAATKEEFDAAVEALEGEDARIEGLVTAEAERAAGAEEALDERLVKVEAFFEKAETETIDEALDTLVEIQKYLEGEGAVADQMVKDIAANKQAIENHVATDHDFAAADATLKSDLEGKIALKADASVVEAMDAAYKAADDAIKGRLDVLEAIDHEAYVDADDVLKTELEGKINAKADTTVVEGIEGRVEELETASATHALKTEVQAVSDALTEYKNAHAGDYTNAQVDAAIKVVADNVAALNDTYASDAELATAIQNEVARADAAYAAKALETTVAEHKADAVAHITAAERTLWNAALQAADIATGTANGTIAVKGADVAVKGLGSAAFTEASAYDAAGAAAAVQTKLDEEVARAKAAEEVNASAIAAFVGITPEEVNALFA